MKKTTPQKLPNRLAQYGALSLAIAGVADANGQIVYTDVDPDGDGTTVANDIFFDIDNNVMHDFQIRQSSSNLLIAPLLNASILGNPNGGALDNYNYPFALNSGAVISNGAISWIPSNGYFQTMNYNSCYWGNGGDYNNWCSVTDKYLGLRFLIGGEIHYGWARLDVLSMPGNWILKDYAYNKTQTIPGQGDPINAGQTVLGIEDNAFSEIKIVALNKSIALFNLPQETEYRVFNMAGQAVLDGKITNDTHVIEANTLASGIYIIELANANSKAVIRKKIVL